MSPGKAKSALDSTKKLFVSNVFINESPVPLAVSAQPTEQCAPGFHDQIEMTLHLAEGPLSLDGTFRDGHCCEAFERVRGGPDNTVAFAASCHDASCTTCPGSTQLIVVPTEAPTEAAFFDIGCAAPAGTLPPLCTRYSVDPTQILVEQKRRQVTPCPTGGVKRARQRTISQAIRGTGITTAATPWEDVHEDLWTCDD